MNTSKIKIGRRIISSLLIMVMAISLSLSGDNSIKAKSNELNIYVVGKDFVFAKEATASFKKKYPDMAVKITTSRYIKDSEGLKKADVIWINSYEGNIYSDDYKNGVFSEAHIETEDILNKYMNKNNLLDIKKDIDSKKLIPGVVKSYTEGSGIYMLPVSIKIPYITIDKKNQSSINSMKNLCKFATSNKVPIFGEGIAYKELMQKLYPIYADQISNKADLTKFLDDFKTLAKSTKAVSDGVLISDIDYMNMLVNNKRKASVGGIDSYAINFSKENHIATIANKEMYIPDNKFIPNSIIAVNKNTSNKTGASEFIKEVYSYDMQAKSARKEIPVNVDAIANMKDNKTKDMFPMVIKEKIYSTEGIEVNWPSNNDFKRLETMLIKVSKPVNLDPTTVSILLNNVDDLMSGKKSAKEISDMCYK